MGSASDLLSSEGVRSVARRARCVLSVERMAKDEQGLLGLSRALLALDRSDLDDELLAHVLADLVHHAVFSR